MAHVRIETSAPRNKKFVKAGPAPSWLWVCGLAYCQEGLTDGFIPHEALPYLGVKNAAQLATHLVGAGLWDTTEGGWLVHDYLQHNRSASQVAAIRDARAEGGRHGGRPKKNHPENLSETSKVSDVKTFEVSDGKPSQKTSPVVVTVDAAVDGFQDRGVGEGFRFDLAFEQLKQLYPKHRVSSGRVTVTAFVDAIQRAPEGPEPAFGRMLSNLALQQRGHEWRVKGMIPKLENWLRQGLWEQQHDEHPATELITDREANTLSAAAAIKRGAVS